MKKEMVLSMVVVIAAVFFVMLPTGCGDEDSNDANGSDGDTDTDSDVDSDSDDGATGDVGDRTEYDGVSLSDDGTYASGDANVTAEYSEYTSAASDTPAVMVSAGGSMTLTHSKATKSGGDTSSEDGSNFYGTNAGVLVSSSSDSSRYTAGSGATIDMTDCTITTAADGANGVFAFGEDAVATLDYVTIETTGNSSRGVDATYGGTINVTNSVISTQGDHCAALATDRYESADPPKINASNVEGTTAGDGSPGIYCTGTFTVDSSTLTATGSEAAAIEGFNSITLTDSKISGNTKWGVIIYQSMSGDSSQGTGSFSMTGGSLTNNFDEGPMFFVCNTSAVITLEDASLINSSDTLLAASTAASAAGCGISDVNTDWGTQGGTVTFTATDQTLEGDILLCDTSSSLSLTLNNSTLTGAINADGVDATVALTLDADSTWEVTGESHLSEFSNNGTVSGSGSVYVGSEQVYP